MADLTGRAPKDTYKNLLQVDNNNLGIDGTLRPLEDGDGSSTTLQLSTSEVNIVSGLKLGGTAVTATADEINYLGGSTGNVQSQLDGKADTIIPTQVNNIALLSATGDLVDSGENIDEITIDGGSF